MPKRICALALDPSEINIIAGDKFGDVYSIPLSPTEDYVRPLVAQQDFQPSATEFTVHTKGNLEALRQQRDQKKITARKEGPDFEHRLLLGHVSLLTDVLIAQSEVAGRERGFILTADRDEHIRCSRYPQAYVIEGYCSGHRDFVSRLCIPNWAPQYLISGGGEPFLMVYDWRVGKMVMSDTLQEVRLLLQETLEATLAERSFEKVAISGIWAVDASDGSGSLSTESARFVLVAMEA
jgi:tRNA (guanine-N(7)-)-methyltransferase subunit TRM82